MNRDADPGARVAAVFEHIAATRMRDFPLSNAALRVEAVGFQWWQDLWTGVLITPWAINLLLLPAGNAAFRALGSGQQQTWQFPSGEYSFFGLEEEGLGLCQMCSLFSPVVEFSAHDEAVATAREIMRVLFMAPAQTGPAHGGPESAALGAVTGSAVGAAMSSAGAGYVEAGDAAFSRRAFMFGRRAS